MDVGGTFTDAVLDDDAGTVLAAKSPSTPPDYSRGVLGVLELLAEQLGRPLPEMLADTHHIAHGTTSSLNALVTGNVPAVGFLTTKGHRDSIFIMNVEVACGHCGEGLGEVERLGVALYEGPPTDAGPQILANAADYVDAPVVFRQYCCPSCWTAIYSAVVPADHRDTVAAR